MHVVPVHVVPVHVVRPDVLTATATEPFGGSFGGS
jgi:hypothetical protein